MIQSQILKFISIFFCFLLFNKLEAQEETNRKLFFRLGQQQLHLLDEQASPILYRAQGIQAQVGFTRQKALHSWEYQLGFASLVMEPSRPELRFGEAEATTTGANLQISYLRNLSPETKWNWQIGGRLQQELLLDFDAIADFPWIFAQGGVFAQGQLDYRLKEKHALSATLALPLFSWIIDMPYHQIPRLEGRVPDVITVIKTGTRLSFWDSFQRFDLGLNYQYSFSPKWQLAANYQWAWFHDREPRGLWAYQGRLGLGLSYLW